MGKKYYSAERIEKVDADYKMLLGGRNIGKSYDVKKNRVLKYCIDNNKEFVYLRRWDRDIKNSNVENYFADLNIKEIAPAYSAVRVWQGKIFLCNYNEKGGAIDNKLIGWVHCLTSHERYKSQMFPQVDHVIFEEFITDNVYLPNEPDILQDYVSTIFRERRGTVWLIGNTISHLCPYFSEWQLGEKVLRLKTHEIAIFENTTPVMTEDGETDIVVKVAVEMCGAENVFSKMAFGQSASMIVKNEWKNKLCARVDEYILIDSKVLYSLYCIYDNLQFKLELREYKGNAFWYVMPFTKHLQRPTETRIIQKEPSPYYLHTTKFIGLSENESKAFSLLKQGKVFYCSNSCGTDFSQVLRQIGF